MSAVMSTLKAHLLFLVVRFVRCVITASGAPWMEFRSLILHLYQTPGGKQAENQHKVSAQVVTTHPVGLSLCLICNKEDKRHQQAFLSHHTSAVHMSISSGQCSSTAEVFEGLCTSAGVQRASYQRASLYHICATEPRSSDVPHSGPLLCFDSRIVSMSYGSNQACPVS